MTTTVVVHPAGHRVKVQLTPKGGEARFREPSETVLEPGTPAQTFYVHYGQDIHVSEIGPDEQVVKAGLDHGSPEEAA